MDMTLLDVKSCHGLCIMKWKVHSFIIDVILNIIVYLFRGIDTHLVIHSEVMFGFLTL